MNDWKREKRGYTKEYETFMRGVVLLEADGSYNVTILAQVVAQGFPDGRAAMEASDAFARGYDRGGSQLLPGWNLAPQGTTWTKLYGDGRLLRVTYRKRGWVVTVNATETFIHAESSIEARVQAEATAKANLTPIIIDQHDWRGTGGHNHLQFSMELPDMRKATLRRDAKWSGHLARELIFKGIDDLDSAKAAMARFLARPLWVDGRPVVPAKALADAQAPELEAADRAARKRTVPQAVKAANSDAGGCSGNAGAHTFIIPPPSGPVPEIAGICKDCGAERPMAPPWEEGRGGWRALQHRTVHPDTPRTDVELPKLLPK